MGERTEDAMDIYQTDLVKDSAAAIAAAEEESYRIQALDYAQGHVAAKVKERDSSKKGGGAKLGGKGPIYGGSLMAAMLKSAATGNGSGDVEQDDPDAADLELEA